MLLAHTLFHRGWPCHSDKRRPSSDKRGKKLTASGGGECPELGMTDLYQALLHCLPESVIYYISGADAKDSQRENEVRSLAKDKKIKISFILTGQCGRRRRRRDFSQSGIQDLAVVPKEIHRVRRNA